jgi:hypothetical protein
MHAQVENEAQIAMLALAKGGSLVPPGFVSFKEDLGMVAVYSDGGTDIEQVSYGLSCKAATACAGLIRCVLQLLLYVTRGYDAAGMHKCKTHASRWASRQL